MARFCTLNRLLNALYVIINLIWFDYLVQWCLAVNNIDYIKRSIRPFVDDLGLTQLMNSLAQYKSEMEAERCKKTLELVVDNAIDTVNNKIIDLLKIVADKVRIYSYHLKKKH